MPWRGGTVEFGWTPDQQATFDRTREQVRAAFGVDPVDASEVDDAGFDGDGFDLRKLWARLGELGLLGLCVPQAYGGRGLGALETARHIEALGNGCPDTGLVFGASAHLFACAVPISTYASEAVKQRLLPGMCSGMLIAGNAMTEADAGSDVSRLAMTAREVPGGFRLNGEKSFVTNGPVADVYVTYATTDPRAGHLGTTAFVVERGSAGVIAGPPFAKMGLESIPAGTVRFEDCFVPVDAVLGEPGQGGAIFQHSMTWERGCLFAGYLGLLDRVFDRCVAHVRSRRQFGHRIGDFQSVSNRLVDMKLRAESARLLLYRACWELDQGRSTPMHIALAKLAVSEGAVESALDAIRLFGAPGYLREFGIEAVLRDTVPTMIFSGTSDIQRMVVAGELGL
jgi:alkylation response protein AidB-like acyl-CoA dehydrogenase